MNLNVETIRKGFPDCIAKRKIGKDLWEEVNIEFEYKSSHFKIHGHLESMEKGSKCDMIVCWEHDWKECPKNIEVLELQSEYLKFDNIEEEPETKTKTKKSDSDTLNKYYKENGKLYEKFEKAILSINKQIWVKPSKHKYFYYSPERLFFNAGIQKQGIKLILFTGGKKINGVEPFTEQKTYAQKWGVFYVFKPTDISKAKTILKISLKYIHAAIRQNENTGWYAEI